ncbi:MAG: glutamyl-tRNA reductase [Euryarchaeota archaeon]|nr:glutamyl-tRNA reductase [Euryarchaeota archaeon]
MFNRILSAHVTHKWATIDDLEMVSAKEAHSILQGVRRLEHVEEAALLKTCNRVEIYVASDEPLRAQRELGEFLSGSIPLDMVRFLHGEDSVRHLMRVAGGLDSMVVGEDQILHQVKEAFQFARDEKALGQDLTRVFQRALQVGREARAETEINKGRVSIGTATVQLAEQLLGSLEGKTVVILGAGEMARLVARALLKRKIRGLFFANRTVSHAQHLAEELRGSAIPYSRLGEALGRADVVICASAAPHVVLTRQELEEMLREARRTRKLVVIDISNPRNIDEAIATLPRVELHNIDGLRRVAHENLKRRKSEVVKVERIIDGALRGMLAKYGREDGEEILRGLYRTVEDIKRAEMERTLQKLQGLSPREREILRALVDSLSNKILATPTGNIRRATARGDVEFLKRAARLFDVRYGE